MIHPEYEDIKRLIKVASNLSEPMYDKCMTPEKTGALVVAAVLMDIRDELHGIRELMEEEREEREDALEYMNQ